jgi:pimeloyl-ACP methyl ester carboxylesterase
MHSSSKLFPVTLSSAEIRGDLSEDVYLLKPNNSPDHSVALAVTRLGRVNEQPGSVPVVLLHGSFSNRRFWYSSAGQGLGAYLARRGFDVWLAEMRGHGLSPRNQQYPQNSVADYARYDVPAIAAFVAEQSGQAPHWLGHSLGGTTLVAALGGAYLAQEQVASLALFGTQVSRSSWLLKVPPVVWAIRLLLRRRQVLSGARAMRGPEDEPIGVVREYLRMQGLFGRFGDREGDWWAGLSKVQAPLLVVAGSVDVPAPAAACRQLFEQFGSPRREFLCLGRQHGFSRDLGHVDMLVSKAAQLEVWPRVAEWLDRAGVPETREG